MPMPANAIYDCKVAGTLQLTDADALFDTVNSQVMYDLATQSAGGALALIALSDLQIMFFLIDCTDCASETYLKLVEPVAAADPTTGCFVIPAGERFSMGVYGMKGTDGLGIRALGVARAGGAAGDEAKVFVQFDSE